MAFEKPKVGFLRLGPSFLKVKDLRIELNTRLANMKEIIEFYDKIASSKGIRYAVADKIELVITQKSGEKLHVVGKKGKVTAEGYLRIWEEVELKNLAGTSYLDSINIELDPLSNSLFLSISGLEETISVDSFIQKNSLTNFDKQ